MCVLLYGVFFLCFFKQKTAYEMRISDWSSDVCSSDLHRQAAQWIINHGHKRSPDQIFEIENHPSGKGFTVRERGRGEPPPDGGNRQAGAQPPEGNGPGVQPTRALPPPDQATPPSEAAETVAHAPTQSRPIREFVDEARGVVGRKMDKELRQDTETKNQSSTGEY